jgi:hypothetical protein
MRQLSCGGCSKEFKGTLRKSKEIEGNGRKSNKIKGKRRKSKKLKGSPDPQELRER